MRLRILGLVCIAALGTSTSAHAGLDLGRLPPPGPAKVRFAPDFPKLKDLQWGFLLGGFGGIRKGYPLHHIPVIFVHGNNVDHVDWYLVRDDFKAAGWSDQELWALSYNGLGNDEGNTIVRNNSEGVAEHQSLSKANGGYGDGIGRIANDDNSVPNLYEFILAVQRYTGSARFSIVAHSLGVTVARKTLKVHPWLRKDLVAFVGIAGGNHGTSLCPPGSDAVLYSCDEVAAGTQWLAALNGPNGSDETYPPAKWMTIREGTGTCDVAFMGTYKDSPILKGATNLQFNFNDHDALRVLPQITKMYREFIQAAEKPYLSKKPRGRKK
ncbi:MAG: alpha/beta hydrolase family protein [Actinomycetota bacterium]